MARIERTYSQEKVKQMLKLNEVLPDRANALNFLPFNIYIYELYLIDY